MSRIISAILDQPERAVKKAIDELEARNGYPSHDVRHLAECIQKIRLKLSDLGLDPDDTTGEELYQALLGKFNHDSQRFNEQFSLVGPSDNVPASLAMRIVLNNFQMPERWALKTSAAKALLKTQPPKNLMRRLNYRSVDSLLKRESIAQIYLGVNYTESAAWLKAHNKLVSGLDSTAFEVRSLNLITHNALKWGEAETGELLAYSNDYAALGLLLPQDSVSSLSLVIALLDALANFSGLRLSQHASKISHELVWWSDMDGLVANLNSEHVSMNLKDVFLNSLRSHSYHDRVLENAQHSFWQDLLSRYGNPLITQEDLNISFRSLLNLSPPLNQPAFEYADDRRL